MGRPSMAGQRIEEILDALEVCILEQGIAATSLESIAQQAGLKRTILRHYIGNRDEIICALSARWRQNYTQQWQEIMSWLPSRNQADSLIDSMFIIGTKERVSSTVIAEAIFSEAKRLAPIKQDQEHIMDEFISHFNQVLSNQYSSANEEKIALVSHGVYANYLLAESFMPLKLIDHIHQLKQSSKLLCSVLDVD